MLLFGMPRFAPNYYLACRIQDKILNMIGVKPQNSTRYDPKEKKDLSPKDLATLSGAWNTLEERKRILRMKPKPRDVEVKEKVKDRKRETFQE
jgi:hypothetical protein